MSFYSLNSITIDQLTLSAALSVGFKNVDVFNVVF